MQRHSPGDELSTQFQSPFHSPGFKEFEVSLYNKKKKFAIRKEHNIN